MGAWGNRAFDNDAANDWAYGLDNVDDLSLVEAAFSAVEEVGTGYLDSDLACDALGACEVLARLMGLPGYTNSYTEKVDQWVAAHNLKLSSALLKRASAVIDRILAENSELRDLWDDAGGGGWRESVEELRGRMRA